MKGPGLINIKTKETCLYQKYCDEGRVCDRLNNYLSCPIWDEKVENNGLFSNEEYLFLLKIGIEDPDFDFQKMIQFMKEIEEKKDV